MDGTKEVVPTKTCYGNDDIEVISFQRSAETCCWFDLSNFCREFKAINILDCNKSKLFKYNNDLLTQELTNSCGEWLDPYISQEYLLTSK